MPPWTLAWLIAYAFVAALAFFICGVVAVGIHNLLMRRNGGPSGKPPIDSQGAWLLAIIIAIPCTVGIMILLTVLFWGLLDPQVAIG